MICDARSQGWRASAAALRLAPHCQAGRPQPRQRGASSLGPPVSSSQLQAAQSRTLGALELSPKLQPAEWRPVCLHSAMRDPALSQCTEGSQSFLKCFSSARVHFCGGWLLVVGRCWPVLVSGPMKRAELRRAQKMEESFPFCSRVFFLQI